MFVVYVKPYGQPRRPMGHFKTESVAKAEAVRVYDAFPSDEVVIIEEADNGRDSFVDAPKRTTGPGAGSVGPNIDVERLAPAGKEGK